MLHQTLEKSKQNEENMFRCRAHYNTKTSQKKNRRGKIAEGKRTPEKSEKAGKTKK